MSARSLALAGCVLAALTATASAHALDVGYLTIESGDQRIAVTLDLDTGAGAILLGTKPAALSAAVVQERADELARATYAASPITTELGACTWTPASATIRGKSVRVTGAALCPEASRDRTWAFPFVRETRISGTFELLVKEVTGDGERLTVVDRYEPTLTLGRASASHGFGRFVRSGIEHILIGLDHILFLLALLLAGGTLWQLAGVATGFTVGHSITLALAALDIVRPPAALIEPLIALSVIIVAAQLVTGRARRHRWHVALGFGLIHGFGFANALSGLELSAGGRAFALVGYNLGVELGQLAIVLVAAPLVILVHRELRVRRVVVPALAGAITLAGVFWFMQRVASLV